MSARRDAALALTDLLDREREAPPGRADDVLARKLATLRALEESGDAPPTDAERDALRALALAAERNRAALEVRRDAGRALMEDLGRRLREVDADGVYTRAELLGTNAAAADPSP